MKRKNALVLLVTVFMFNVAFAQPNKREQREAQKIAFITKLLALTPEEAQKFWPVYNQFEADQKALKKQQKESLKRDGQKTG